ncbi:hypothetical protein Tco_1152934 [Tanacetum coccineum]
MSDITACLNDLSYIPLNNEQNEPSQGDISEISNEPTQAKRNEFEELYVSANEELYSGCDSVTRLDFMAKFIHFKVKGKLTDSIFNEMLEFFQMEYESGGGCGCELTCFVHAVDIVEILQDTDYLKESSYLSNLCVPLLTIHSTPLKVKNQSLDLDEWYKLPNLKCSNSWKLLGMQSNMIWVMQSFKFCVHLKRGEHHSSRAGLRFVVGVLWIPVWKVGITIREEDSSELGSGIGRPNYRSLSMCATSIPRSSYSNIVLEKEVVCGMMVVKVIMNDSRSGRSTGLVPSLEPQFQVISLLIFLAFLDELSLAAASCSAGIQHMYKTCVSDSGLLFGSISIRELTNHLCISDCHPVEVRARCCLEEMASGLPWFS